VPVFVTHCLENISGLPRFIKELQGLRGENREEIDEAMRKADEQMFSNGIVAVGDISNGSSSFAIKETSNIYYHTFLEVFGLDPKDANKVFKQASELQKQAQDLGLSACITPHAAYSVSSELFELMHNEEGFFSMHNQESESENELFKFGKGELAKSLQSLGANMEKFGVTGNSSLKSVLSYFPTNCKLQLVHNTFTTKYDLEFATSYSDSIYWCFCPRANRYIEDALPDFNLFVPAKSLNFLVSSSFLPVQIVHNLKPSYQYRL